MTGPLEGVRVVELGVWDGHPAPAPAVAPEPASSPAEGQAILATWRMGLDESSAMAGEPAGGLTNDWSTQETPHYRFFVQANDRMSAQAFVNQFAGDMGPDAIEHHAGGLFGRAKLTSDASSGVEIGILDGYSAVVGTGAVIRIEFDDPGDWQWAIEMWKSLAPA